MAVFIDLPYSLFASFFEMSWVQDRETLQDFIDTLLLEVAELGSFLLRGNGSWTAGPWKVRIVTILQLDVFDEDIDALHEVSKEDQIKLLLFFRYLIGVVQHAVPYRFLDHIELLNLIHVLFISISKLFLGRHFAIA